MSDDQNQPAKRSRVSSAYVRVVGDATIEVVNTKQRDDVPKAAKAKKWAVVVRSPTKSGNIRTVTHATCDKKYDAIDALLAHERQLKAKKDDE